MSPSVYTFEDLIEQLGNPGRFQIIMLLLLYTMEIPVAWATMLMSFAGKAPDWWCQDDVINTTGRCSAFNNMTYRHCPGNQSSCGEICFDPQMRTVVSEWSLVCDKTAITATITSIQMAGNLVGAIVSGQLADVYGRKLTLYLELLILVVSCTIAAFATSWQMYSVCTFSMGISCGGYLVTHFPQGVEFVQGRWRTVVGCFPFWSLGFAVFGLIAWPIHDFKHISLLIAATGAPFLLTYRCISSIVYYGLSFGARNLVGHIYLNITPSGMAELPRIPVVIFLNDKTLGSGACNIAAGVGSIIAPYAVLMAEHDLVIPNAVIGCLVLANTALPFLLQETIHKPLPDMITETTTLEEETRV